ncbi:PH domain-containing protein [Leucobacter iarius]|uniref:PH domain-containing protein n=1 Tax=Leucobacter iarius TaxID=333963 RepID=A0ABN2LC72_9MICO
MRDPAVPAHPFGPAQPGGGAQGQPAIPSDGEWRRLHPLSPLLRGGLFVLVLFGIIVANLRDQVISLVIGNSSWNQSPENGGIDYIFEHGLVVVALLVVAGIIALVILFSWLSYRFAQFRIADDAVELRRGVLFKQHRRAPLDRIQAVDLQRQLLARVLGLTQVEVQTAGQGGKLTLAYLGHRDAQAVREQILRLVRAQTAGTASADPAAVDPAAAAAAEGTAGTADATATADAQSGSRLRNALDLESRVTDFADDDVDQGARMSGTLVTVPLGRLVGSIVLGWGFLVAIVLVGVIGGFVIAGHPAALAGLIPIVIASVAVIVSHFNRGFGFTLSRSDDAIRIGAGLTATRTETIPFARVHAVDVRQPLLWKPFGWWQVRITLAGNATNGSDGQKVAGIVLPVGTLDDAVRVTQTILGDRNFFAASGGGAEGPLSYAVLRDGIAGAGGGYLGAGPRSGLVLWAARRRTGIAVTEPGPGSPHTLALIRRGVLTRGYALVPLARAQSVLLHRTFFHRALGLARVRVHTVFGPVPTEIAGLELDHARRLFEQLAAQAVAAQRDDVAGTPR